MQNGFSIGSRTYTDPAAFSREVDALIAQIERANQIRAQRRGVSAPTNRASASAPSVQIGGVGVVGTTFAPPRQEPRVQIVGGIVTYLPAAPVASTTSTSGGGSSAYSDALKFNAHRKAVQARISEIEARHARLNWDVRSQDELDALKRDEADREKLGAVRPDGSDAEALATWEWLRGETAWKASSRENYVSTRVAELTGRHVQYGQQRT